MKNLAPKRKPKAESPKAEPFNPEKEVQAFESKQERTRAVPAKARVHITMPNPLKERIDQEVHVTGIPRTQLIARILYDYFHAKDNKG